MTTRVGGWVLVGIVVVGAFAGGIAVGAISSGEGGLITIWQDRRIERFLKKEFSIGSGQYGAIKTEYELTSHKADVAYDGVKDIITRMHRQGWDVRDLGEKYLTPAAPVGRVVDED